MTIKTYIRQFVDAAKLLTTGQKTALTPETGWTDLAFPPTAVNPPGGIAGAVYNITDSTLDFENGSDHRIDVTYQMPHEWDLNTPLYFHLHTYRSTNESGKKASWQVKWRYADGEASKPAWTTDANALIDVPSGTGPAMIGIKVFTPTTLTLSSCVQIQLIRLASSDANDTYNGNIQVFSLDLHYKKVRAMGSTNPSSL